MSKLKAYSANDIDMGPRIRRTSGCPREITLWAVPDIISRGCVLHQGRNCINTEGK